MPKVDMMRRMIYVLVVYIMTIGAINAKATEKWEFLGPEGAWLTGRLTFSSLEPDTLYASVYGPLVKTKDAGDHWQRLLDAPFYISEALAISPSNPNIIYASNGSTYNTPDGNVRSDDGGLTWQTLTKPVRYDTKLIFIEIAVHPQNPMIVYGVPFTFRDCIYRSDDGGMTWQELPIGFNVIAIDRVAIDPKHPEIIYTAGMNGIYKSKDSGETWQVIIQGLTIEGEISVQSITVDPLNTENVYVALKGGIFGSSDGGEHWRDLTKDKVPSQTFFTKLSVDPTNSRSLYASSYAGIFKSTDAGKTWKNVWKGFPVSDIAVHPKNSRMIYALVWRIGFLRSDDGGFTWEIKSHGIDNASIIALSISRSNPEVICSTGACFYRSMDNGNSWLITGSEGVSWWDYGAVNFSDIAIYPANPKIVYGATTTQSAIAKSTDGGQHWSLLWSIGAPNMQIAVDPTDPNVIYVSTLEARNPTSLLRSLDGGETWEDITPPFIPLPNPPNMVLRIINNVAFHPTDPNTIFLANSVGVAKSSNRGETWENISWGLNGAVNAIAVDPTNGDRMFAVDEGHIYQTIDGGQSWDVLDRISAKSVAVSSAGADVAIYAAGKRVWMSMDGGVNWESFEDGLPEFREYEQIYKIVTHPTKAKTVFIVASTGVYRYSMDGETAISEYHPLTIWGTAKNGQLFPNYPNPFTHETWIPYQLSQDNDVSISIYDINGNLVRKLNLGYKNMGDYLSTDKAGYWDGKNDIGEPVASGIYFCFIEAGYFRDIQKMVMLGH
jgi:photosystem II stability/assembly factor-like uncharacterized protein